MRNRCVLIVALVLATAVVPATTVAQSTEDCSFPVEMTDATGAEVRVTEEPSRVVTLNPSAAQTMWEIGAQEKVVGVTKYAMNLEGAETKTNISGDGQTISNEEVVGLEPDLVLAPNTIGNDTVRTLREANLTVYRFGETGSLEGIIAKTRIIGRLSGECAGAEDTVAWMQSRLATVDSAVAGADRPDVIYVFYGFTAGENTFIHTILERAGGNNVAADAGIDRYQQVNDEILVQHDPDWIVLNTDWNEVPKRPAYNSTTAVREGQIVRINTNHLNRPAPRTVYAVSKLARTFHPDAYAAANATATPTDTAQDTPTPTDSTPTAAETPTAETPAAEGPGFGALAALVALAAVVLLGRTRR